MAANDAVERQRDIRAHIQAARREMKDPHMVGKVLLDDIKQAAEGLQDYRASMPLIAEIGDTLAECATLIGDLCEQVASLKGQVGGKASATTADEFGGMV